MVAIRFSPTGAVVLTKRLSFVTRCPLGGFNEVNNIAVLVCSRLTVELTAAGVCNQLQQRWCLTFDDAVKDDPRTDADSDGAAVDDVR